jgi:hypothetical protein
MQAQALGYQAASPNALNAPRQLGFVERASGLASGLEGLEGRLEGLLSRVDGTGGTNAIKAASPPLVGMSSCFSDAENHLRACLSLIDELHKRF